MKAIVKKIIMFIPILNTIFLYRKGILSVFFKKYGSSPLSRLEKYKAYLSIFLCNNFIISNNKIKRNNRLLSRIKIIDNKKSSFFYSIDESTLIVPLKNNNRIGNLTPDYTVLLDSSISSLEKKYKEFKQVIPVLEDIKLYCGRCIAFLEEENLLYNEQKIYYLKRLVDHVAETFFEAIQRILFINYLLWQEGHKLIGIGHLDKILFPYYKHDIDNGILDKDKAFHFIKEFLVVLHNNYEYKSNTLTGDTGQIIILGGLSEDGTYICNDLTYMFIDALKELQIPDPKILLRVHRLMPLELLQTSLRCIQTGIGCPLFANDEVIIPKLIDFGYEKKDVYGYGTSACWEPFVIGKSADANNVASFNFLIPLQEALFSNKEDYVDYTHFLLAYKQNLQIYIQKIMMRLTAISWEPAPLLSLFIDNCIEKQLDVSEGGAKYIHYGITTVALANAVNSILNIKKYVYELKILSLFELKKILLNNYDGHSEGEYDNIRKLFENEQTRYGVDNDEVLDVTNDIIMFTTEVISKNRSEGSNRKIKFGLSSPSYISASSDILATPDGRKKGSPFAVHISNDKAADFTSLFSFASKINYSENRFNGNVVDCIVSPHFIRDNFDKFILMIYNSFISGIFEMQFNVMDSTTLIQAKENPEQFQHLIVRVWGFSAYFNDLPEEYKNVLIKRTIEHEHAYN
jgi:formate C-acetyltransferase